MTTGKTPQSKRHDRVTGAAATPEVNALAVHPVAACGVKGCYRPGADGHQHNPDGTVV